MKWTKRFNLNSNVRAIVYATIREDSKHRQDTRYNRCAALAIQKAKDDLDIGKASPDIRKIIADKIYQLVADSTPWELLGETYCNRSMFYQHRKHFCYLVADNLGMISDKRRQHNQKKADNG